MSEQMQEQYSSFDQTDIDNNKTIVGLAYLIFFLPLVACPESKYARFHANQSLLLLIIAVAVNIVLSIIPIVGWILLPVYALATLVFAVLGMSNGFRGKAKRLPIFGKYDILK